MGELAVIILNYNSWKDTLRIIEECHKTYNIDYQDIIVVDNASQNDSAKMLKNESERNKFVLIISERNDGYAAGNNIGLKYAVSYGYKYGWILNNDIIFTDIQYLTKVLAVFSLDNKIAVVNSDVYDPTGYLYNRDAVKPNFWDYTLGMYSYKKKGRNVLDLGGYGFVYRPQGCCMIVDLHKIQEVDFLDENTFLYCEEVILAERLLDKDYGCACRLDTSIIHNHSKTVKKSIDRRKIIKITNNSFKYYLKRYRRFNGFKVLICCIFNTIKLTILD